MFTSQFEVEKTTFENFKYTSLFCPEYVVA